MAPEERELLMAIAGAMMQTMAIEADRAEPGPWRYTMAHHAKILAAAMESVRNAEPTLTVTLRGGDAEIEHKGTVT